VADLFEVPDEVAAAASSLADIGSAISSANAAAEPPTTGMVASGADDVSLGVADLFTAHALSYQNFSSQLMAFHLQFVQNLAAAANAYTDAEAQNTAAVADPGQSS
jgi:hypothetical protein